MFIQIVFTVVVIALIFLLVYVPFNYFFPGSEEEQRLEEKQRELAKAKLLVKTVEEQEKIQNELSKVQAKLNKLRRKKNNE